MLRTSVALVCVVSLVAAEAPTIANAPLPTYTAAEKRHWAFQPIAKPAVPQFTRAADRAWAAKSPIDAFILERLNKDGLRPAPAADRASLLRRATFDLWGLPPTPAELDAFLADRSPNAWEKVIDRLLAAPQYGERWAQHWLDVVRFAESDGFEYDTHRADAWRYRDYVIHAFNSDKRYDEFIREQLAGDEINPRNEQYRIASGFQRLGALRKNAGNQEVASSRNEVLTEMTNIVGSAFLGLTLGCARCHDHKFDAIRQSDYYRVQAYFAQTHENEVPLASESEQSAWKTRTEAIDKEVKELRARMKGMKGPELADMQKKVAEKEALKPEPLPALYSVANDTSRISPMNLLTRGDYQARGAAVGMRPLGILTPANEPELPLDTAQPRTKLASWVLSPENPLTARVIANRLWHYHFGRGIVATPNDFGRMGSRPTHRELLDYLASDFTANGWTLKRLHRQILLSNTYQQSVNNPAMAKLGPEKDADRTLLWAFPRKRLEAEQMRDAMLAVAGILNPKAGGPSILIPVDPDLVQLLYKPSQWKVNADPAEHDRRSIYLMQKRNLRVPFLEVFDSPDRAISCARRDASTHAPQALEMLNGDISNHAAQAFAARLRKEAGPTPSKQIDLAYRLAASRLPTLAEKTAALAFLRSQPLTEFALAILNTNAFLYVN